MLNTPTLTRPKAPSTKVKAAYYDMIVFSSMRWNFIYQRPQHMVSRMAKKRNVLFVELPIDFDAEEKNTANLIVINDHITVLQPRVDNIKDAIKLVQSYVTNDIVPLGLFYSPTFSPLLEAFTFDKVVYDCVGDFSFSHKDAMKLSNKESYLISEADLILTNEQSIYDSKFDHHTNVHCLPNLSNQFDSNMIPTAMLDRTAERMEVLIRSCRNYGVLI